MILLRLLVSRFLFPAVSSPQTENTRSAHASDARADSRSWASGANGGFLLAFVTQNSNSLFSETADNVYTKNYYKRNLKTKPKA